MAQFRVGQRVRTIGCDNSMNRHLVGMEATIIGRTRERCPAYGERIWKLDIPDRAFGEPYTLAASRHIAPIEPRAARADEFMARLKKLGSEPVNAKVTERVAK